MLHDDYLATAAAALTLRTRDDFPNLWDLMEYKEGVEIGVNYGVYSRHILDNSHTLFLHGVDPFRGLFAQARGSAEQVTADYPDRYELHIESSADAVSTFPDNSLDFIYIDADHTFDAVMKDIALWWPKVKKPGGFFGGHDYRIGRKYRAVDAIINNQPMLHMDVIEAITKFPKMFGKDGVIEAVDKNRQIFDSPVHITIEKATNKTAPSWWVLT